MCVVALCYTPSQNNYSILLRITILHLIISDQTHPAPDPHPSLLARVSRSRPAALPLVWLWQLEPTPLVWLLDPRGTPLAHGTPLKVSRLARTTSHVSLRSCSPICCRASRLPLLSPFLSRISLCSARVLPLQLPK